MGWPSDMPNDESYIRQMVEDMHHAVQSLERALFRGNNGTEGLLTELSHVKRTTKDNADALASLRSRVAALESDGKTSGPKDDRAMWKAVAAWAQPIGTLLAIALATATAMGWI